MRAKGRGYHPGDKKAEPKKTNRVGNDQCDKGFRSRHDAKSRPQVYLRDDGQSKKVHQDAESE